jgi:magnesium transporter
MAFLSELMDRPVSDIDGKFIGNLADVIARLRGDLAHPVVEAIVVRQKNDTKIIPFSAVAVLISPAIPLSCRVEDVEPYIPDEQDIYLVEDVLDKQIIDTDGARVVRVNDLELLRVNGTILVSNVDIGVTGILRRFGLVKSRRNVLTKMPFKVPENFISWDDVELLRQDQFMRLRVPVEKLSELHPADVAEILSDLNKLQTGQFLDALDVEHLADALEEVEPEFQASLIEGMPAEKVADVLEEMEPDEAADLLAELPTDRSQDLLALMDQEEADEVRRLLTYPEESAGGIMTTAYVSVRPDLTAEQALQVLRETGSEAETIFYIYVTDDENHLIGVFSLSSLIFARPEALVSDFMQKRVITVHLLDDQEDIAQTISKYNLLAVPVMNDEEQMQGIVTADDALDKIIPTAWKKRLPRFFR